MGTKLDTFKYTNCCEVLITIKLWDKYDIILSLHCDEHNVTYKIQIKHKCYNEQIFKKWLTESNKATDLIWFTLVVTCLILK